MEKIVSASDSVSFIQAPATFAKINEVAPFLMNGVVLIGSGGKR